MNSNWSYQGTLEVIKPVGRKCTKSKNTKYFYPDQNNVFCDVEKKTVNKQLAISDSAVHTSVNSSFFCQKTKSVVSGSTKYKKHFFSCFCQMMKQDRQLDSSILEASQIFPHSFLVEFTTVVLLHFTSEASIVIHSLRTIRNQTIFLVKALCYTDLSVYLIVTYSF